MSATATLDAVSGLAEFMPLGTDRLYGGEALADEPGDVVAGDWLITDRAEAGRVVEVADGVVVSAVFRRHQGNTVVAVEVPLDGVVSGRAAGTVRRVTDSTVRGSAAFADWMRGRVVAGRDGVVRERRCDGHGNPLTGATIGSIGKSGREWTLLLASGESFTDRSKRVVLAEAADVHFSVYGQLPLPAQQGRRTVLSHGVGGSFAPRTI